MFLYLLINLLKVHVDSKTYNGTFWVLIFNLKFLNFVYFCAFFQIFFNKK